MNVVLMAKPGGPQTGIGRYVSELTRGLDAIGEPATLAQPTAPVQAWMSHGVKRVAGLDVRAFFDNFPVWAAWPPADVYHLTGQNLASILYLRRPPGKIVVTVHDIIPFLVRHQPALCSYQSAAHRYVDYLATWALRQADALVTDSHATAASLIRELGIPPSRMTVVHLGVDQERFQPRPVPADLPRRLGLEPERPFLLYVGTEDPRKDLPTLLRALAIVRQARPDVQLIKAGRAHFDDQRRRLLSLIRELHLEDAVHFLDDVAEADLPPLYNLARVFVTPSRYEGFGFPALEAMACGRPVVSSRAGSLPEIVGEAGLLVPPGDPQWMAEAVIRVLDDPGLAQRLGELGRERAAHFTWNRTVNETLGVYERVAGGRSSRCAPRGGAQAAG